jgi:hypothetical protein
MSENSEIEEKALRATLEISHEMKTLVADIQKCADKRDFTGTYTSLTMLLNRAETCLDLLEEDVEPEDGEGAL